MLSNTSIIHLGLLRSTNGTLMVLQTNKSEKKVSPTDLGKGLEFYGRAKRFVDGDLLPHGGDFTLSQWTH